MAWRTGCYQGHHEIVHVVLYHRPLIPDLMLLSLCVTMQFSGFVNLFKPFYYRTHLDDEDRKMHKR